MEREEDIITIDFKALLRVLWKEKWLILAITSLFVIGGALYAFTAREEFVSEGKILPEVSGGTGSSLGGLANLVGIGGFELGLKNNTDAIRPDLYPDVIKSTPFFLDLFQQKFINQLGDSVRFESFYHQKIEKSKVPDEKDLKKFEGSPVGVLILNRLTENRIKELKERLNASIDKKSGVITISAKMPDPVMAAEVASFSMEYLTNYVTDYRTEKLKQEVDFLGQKVAAARGEFYRDQSRKASYADQFAAPSIRLKLADVQRERIESEYRLSSNFYNELLKKYEEAKLKLQQETPIFQVLEPPIASTFKSEPARAMILIFSLTGGVFFAIIFAFFWKKNLQIVTIRRRVRTYIFIY
ncbi:Wzz/FepE/Etk N-terminal domain-containing protein [Jiulongibacter sediminis]|uniref:Wzz/FepE/Etk N-terminal domain-containing protein n=1 Tax=Jiulongibacter sediminis TaxID=1605367 RepID=UPI0026EE0E5A|nr:Wzz/FepE/Etk N-terminal domain-containing protein [Jiulongibacter sediminis]